MDIVHLIPFFGFPFSSQVVVYGHCLVTFTHNHLVAVSCHMPRIAVKLHEMALLGETFAVLWSTFRGTLVAGVG